MAKANVNKLYRTFVKGLITEASPLTYPEDASIDEENCVLFRRGNRSRRLGFDLEPDFQYNQYPTPLIGNAIVEYRWEAVGGDVNVNFLVVQMNSTLFFYDMAITPLSAGLKPFFIYTYPYGAPNTQATGDLPYQMISGKGYLFVVGQHIEPLIVEYHPDTNTVSVEVVHIKVRDFEGIDTGYDNDFNPTTLTNDHKYNLQNQGWSDTAGNIGLIDKYHTQFGSYPSNSQQWWIAKATEESTGVEIGDFDPKLLGKFYFGNTHAPRGRYIVDAFSIDRSLVSGIPGLVSEQINERPPAVTFFSGRVWYGLKSTVYFSQVLDSKRKAGRAYQEADPTAEDISDLIATDGGTVEIPEMGFVVRMVAMGSGVIVFANNGVWFITGTSQGFTASDISVNKISDIGTDSPLAVVEADGSVYWWSKVGIQALSQKSGMFGPVEGSFDKTNISETTVQTLYINSIPDLNKRWAKGLFDPATNTIQWLTNLDSNPSPYTYNYILNLDLTLGAFFPWKVEAGNPYIVGVFLDTKLKDFGEPTSIRSTFLTYTTIINDRLTIGYFRDFDFVDWQSVDNVGKPYMSFIEGGYELLEDAMRKKQTPYVFCYFRQTERNYVPSGGDFVADRPSSCYLQVKWDWANSRSSNKWSPKIQVYRLNRVSFVNEDNLSFDYGFPIVWTKNKVRGTGKAIQFRYESDERGKDFDLLGWSVAYSGNTVP